MNLRKIRVHQVTFTSSFASIGNHHRIMVDICEEMILGDKIVKGKRVYTRRPICKKKRSKKYIWVLVKHIKLHRLQDKTKDKK